MRSRIITILSRRRPPALVGYGVTLATVLAVWGFEQAFHPPLHFYVPYLPVIFFAAIVFDREAGLLATLASAALADRYFLLSPGVPNGGSPEWLFLVLFVGTGFGISFLVHALSQAVGQLSATEEEKSLLLDELVHRTRNDLMMISQVLAFQAQREREPQVRAALESAVARVQVVAQAQDRLRVSGRRGRVEAAGYLQALGHGLCDLLQGVRPITVHVEASPMDLEARVVVSIGLIANELVTNAFKHAYPNGRGGIVRVTLAPAGGGIELAVEDDGVGCSVAQDKGLGSRLLQLLVSNLGGRMEREPVPQGHRVRVSLPIEPVRLDASPDTR